jgi:hypothetical protein
MFARNMQAKSIKELIEIALSSNQHAEYNFTLLTKQQAKIIEEKIGIDLTGVHRIIDTYGIKHAIKEHGSASKEHSRGQEPVNLDDFLLIPQILKEPDKIEYAGKNSLRQDVFKFSKRVGWLYIVAEAVRVSSKGNKLVFITLYKRK